MMNMSKIAVMSKMGVITNMNMSTKATMIDKSNLIDKMAMIKDRDLHLRNRELKDLAEKIFSRKVLIAVIASMAVIILTAILIPKKAFAENSFTRQKTVTSLKIEEGDSLWAIAKEFYQEENGSLMSYIEEIKRCNGLSTDEIHAGYYLVIPYYME